MQASPLFRVGVKVKSRFVRLGIVDSAPAALATSHPLSTRSLATSTNHAPPSLRCCSSRSVHTSATAPDSSALPAFQVKVAVSELPHPEKDHGDDASFVHIVPTTGYTWLGVFDGVGGWSEQGIDPAEYAKALSHHCREIVSNPKFVATSYAHEIVSKLRYHTTKALPLNVPSPCQVLRRAYDAVEKLQIIGSTTACICVVTPKWLVYSNLGDSGLKLIRNGKIAFKTTEKQHAFNTPYQLGGGGADQPEDGDEGAEPVQHGDIIVLGTDGLFDNLFDDDIENIIAGKQISSASTPFRSRPRSPSPTRSTSSTSTSTTTSPAASITTSTTPTPINVLSDLNAVAQRISEEAQKRAQLPDYESPFQVAASKYHKHFRGGKLDDITVVVAQILINHEHVKLSTGSYFLTGDPIVNHTLPSHATVATSIISSSIHTSSHITLSEASESSSPSSPSRRQRSRSPQPSPHHHHHHTHHQQAMAMA